MTAECGFMSTPPLLPKLASRNFALVHGAVNLLHLGHGRCSISGELNDPS